MKLRNAIFYVKDINQAKAFYEKLGFKVSDDFGKFVSYETEQNDPRFSIMESDSPDKVPGKQVCVFWADDIETFCEKMKSLGVAVATELYDSPFGKSFAIRDIDGNKIEFVQR